MSSAKIGLFNELEICKTVDFGYYLSSDQGEILLPTNETLGELKERQKIIVFIYKDSEDRLIATQKKPKAILDEFAFLEVKEMNKTGAFMNWGLLKDLLVPYREQHTRMSKGESHVIKVCLDQKSQRLIGISKISAFLEKEDIQLQLHEQVNLMIYEITGLGYTCIINNKYSGILYHNEVFIELNIGDKIIGYIKKVRDDNKIDLSINPIGYIDAIPQFAENILKKLQESHGFLPFHDKSDPDTIQMVFKMSKKAFKKSCGLLYKKNLIVIKESGIYFKKP